MNHTCAFHALTGQNVSSEKELLAAVKHQKLLKDDVKTAPGYTLFTNVTLCVGCSQGQHREHQWALQNALIITPVIKTIHLCIYGVILLGSKNLQLLFSL